MPDAPNAANHARELMRWHPNERSLKWMMQYMAHQAQVKKREAAEAKKLIADVPSDVPAKADHAYLKAVPEESTSLFKSLIRLFW